MQQGNRDWHTLGGEVPKEPDNIPLPIASKDMKDLKEKAIDIKGKKYVLVSDRVIYFNETYPKGCITTEWISTEPQMVVVKASVHPDGYGMGTRTFTGYSQAKWGDGYINRTSALENAETSAVGRALAFMGIGVLDSIASVDEINKTQTAKSYTPTQAAKKAEIKDITIDESEKDAGSSHDEYWFSN